MGPMDEEGYPEAHRERHDSESLHWSPKAAVKKEDQFTAAPDFIDPYESDHLPSWGRLAASWHGMAPQRRVLVASSMVVFAGAIGALALLTVMDTAGSDPSAPSGGLSAAPGAGPLDGIDALPSAAPRSTPALNSTAPAPPLPSLPSVP
ncbi:MAG TPA: hypothetical protein VM327_09475 [Candidatus Thermoplasmatota archaeon]|nr:hypothetical protein [Candidatus Thermoplasmatota archaeon]